MTDAVEIVKKARCCPRGCYAKDKGIKCWSDKGSDDEARAIITALQADGWQKVPEGWRVVPKEPTEAMSEAGADKYAEIGHWLLIDPMYKAMLAASPSPDTSGEQKP